MNIEVNTLFNKLLTDLSTGIGDNLLSIVNINFFPDFD